MNSKLRLYALERLRFYSDNLQLEEDQEFKLDEKLFEILICLLKDHENIYIKYEILEIFCNFCTKSTNCCESFLDIDYISTIYALLNSSNNVFIEKGLTLIGNIIISLNEAYEYIITHFPLEIKLKELLLCGKFDNDNLICSNILWVLKTIIKEANIESLEAVKYYLIKI